MASAFDFLLIHILATSPFTIILKHLKSLLISLNYNLYKQETILCIIS